MKQPNSKRILREYIEVDFREITTEEYHQATAFQEVLTMLLEAFQTKGWTGLKSFRDYQNLKKDLNRFSNYPWFGGIKKFFTSYDDRFKEYFQNRRMTNRFDPVDFRNTVDDGVAAFMAGDIQSFPGITERLRSVIDAYNDAQDDSFIKDIRNPLYIENPLIFQTTNFVKVFEKNHMEEIIEKDIRQYKYTYLTIPYGKENNFQYIVHWINELRDSAESVELATSEFQKYSKFVYDDNPDYDNLVEMVSRYLGSNDKNILPKIFEELKKFPELVKANNKKKSEIEYVYRGLGFNEDRDEGYHVPDENEIIENDRKRRYVATSVSSYAAKNFAYKIGHLESEEARRSDTGVIIRYKVSPESILFVTDILEGKFGESEVIIDATKAEAVGYNWI